MKITGADLFVKSLIKKHTLKKILEDLIQFYGFDTLSELIKIKCFTDNPSLKSSLTFLRKTPWAREKVEQLYLKTLPKIK